MYAEVFRDRRWSLAEPLQRNPAFDSEHPQEEPEWKPTEIFRERNYALFAILAGVCNPTCSAEPFESITSPRGLPGDLSEPLRTWHAQNDGDTWSESWLLLKENPSNLTGTGKPSHVRRKSIRGLHTCFLQDKRAFPTPNGLLELGSAMQKQAQVLKSPGKRPIPRR